MDAHDCIVCNTKLVVLSGSNLNKYFGIGAQTPPRKHLLELIELDSISSNTYKNLN